MIVLSFDISRKAVGYAAGEGEIEESGSFSAKNLNDAYNSFKMLLRKWQPDYTCYAKPTRFYAAIRAQARVEGVLELAVEGYNSTAKKKTKIIDSLVDSQCKKEVLGNGRADKGEICEHYGKFDEDEADSMMFFDYFLRQKIHEL